MKRIFILSLLVVMVFGVNAQDRVNREKIDYVQVSEVLKEGTGWCYNETLGEWIDYERCLCSDKSYKTTYKSLANSEYMWSRYGNYNTIQTKVLEVNGARYYILDINEWTGYYKYPTIREDWRTYKRDKIYIISEEDFRNLYNLTNDKLFVEAIGSFSSIDKETEIPKIEEKIASGGSHSKYLIEGIIIYKSTDGFIRFNFGYKSDLEKTIDKKYYEITEAQFNKILF